MTGFRTPNKTTDLPRKWGRVHILTTQERKESRFPSIRVIAQPGSQDTLEKDFIPIDRNSENERTTNRVRFSVNGSLCNQNRQCS